MTHYLASEIDAMRDDLAVLTASDLPALLRWLSAAAGEPINLVDPAE